MAAQIATQTQRRAASTGQPGLIAAVRTRPLIHLPRQLERAFQHISSASDTGPCAAASLDPIQARWPGRQLLPVTRRPILGPDAATRLEHGAYPQGELL